MASRHSTRRRGSTNEDSHRLGRRLVARVERLKVATTSQDHRKRLMAGYYLLGVVVEGLRHDAPPFNDRSDPILLRTLELAKDVIAQGLGEPKVRPAPARRLVRGGRRSRSAG